MAATAAAGSKRSRKLLAVFLITRSRPGPKLVFHYPPSPTVKSDHHDSAEDGDLSDSESDDEPGDNRGRGASDSTVRHVGGHERPELEISDPLERVLGHGTETLERFLAPGRWSDKRKFEVCLDGVAFVGLPVYAKEDGTWKKNAEGDLDAKPVKHAPAPALSKEASVEDLSGNVAGITITSPPNKSVTEMRDFTHAPDSLDSKAAASFGTSMGSASTASGVAVEQMTMFHVVLALSGPSADDVTSNEVFEHVARPLSKALKYCQKQNNYVTAESRKILALKTKAKAEKVGGTMLWTQMLEHSELAWVLKGVYTQISAGEIANVRLDGNELSLQIPPKSDAAETYELSLQSAILLLEDRAALLHNLANASTDSSTQALAYFVRECTPTKSLAKHATNLSLPPKTVLYLAQHLIQWRKARAIAPLHPRNTYIVHPEAPLHQLSKLSDDYARSFPALPSLESMLRMLGGRPVRYGLLIQSRDHRAAYMEILAWLVQHRLVMQLRTFGWLRSSPVNGQVDDRSDGEEDCRLEPTSVAGLLGARLRSRSREGGDADSDQASEDTAVPVDTLKAPDNGELVAEPEIEGTGLIIDPQNPTSSQKILLQRIRASLDDAEFKTRFASLLQYFDGEHAFEEIAGREGLKRAKVEEWIGGLERKGWVRSVRWL